LLGGQRKQNKNPNEEGEAVSKESSKYIKKK